GAGGAAGSAGGRVAAPERAAGPRAQVRRRAAEPDGRAVRGSLPGRVERYGRLASGQHAAGQHGRRGERERGRPRASSSTSLHGLPLTRWGTLPGDDSWCPGNRETCSHRRDGGAADRRDGGAAGRPNGAASERRDGGEVERRVG